jgi:hypothetical protein
MKVPFIATVFAVLCISYWKMPSSGPELLMKHSIMLNGAF